MNKNRKYYILLALLFVIVIAIQYSMPKPISWLENYSKSSKIPYGCFILEELLPDLFKNQEIIETKIPIYNTTLSYQKSNYIFINNNFEPDELDTETLFNYVRRGNNVFIAARTFSGPFADSLKLKTEGDYFFAVSEKKTTNSVLLNFENPILKQTPSYSVGSKFYNYYLTDFDSTNAKILGTSTIDNTINLGKSSVLSLNAKAAVEKNINFIKLKIGRGTIYINTLPTMFTNYYLTDTLNYSYAIKALSYLPNQPVIWDEYYKANKKDIATPLRFVLNQPALKFAYTLLILSLLFYILFKIKRTQRIIPVITPLSNSTTDFVGVVSSMYYQENNHLNLAKKKITYFLESIRAHYLLNTETLDIAFINNLALKSGVNVDVTKSLIEKIKAIQQINSNFTETDLVSLNNLITKFNQTKSR